MPRERTSLAAPDDWGGLMVAAQDGHGGAYRCLLGEVSIWPYGLFQLLTGVRRCKSYGAQWAMILSGAQSGLQGSSC